MFRKELDSSKIMKNTHEVLNSLKDNLNKVIANKKLYNYIINNINEITIESILISHDKLEIINSEELFIVEFINGLNNIKEVKTNYLKKDYSEIKNLKINEDIIELCDNKLISKDKYRIQTSLIKTYKNNILRKMKNTRIEFDKNKINDFEIYINGNKVIGKKTITDNGIDKEEYFLCEFAYQPEFQKFNGKEVDNGSGFLEEYIYMYIEKYPTTKEIFDAEINNYLKDPGIKTLSKRKK